MTGAVLSEIAEQARMDIRLLEAEYVRGSTRRQGVLPGRIPGFEPTVSERTLQLVITTIVAVTEHFSAARLIALPGTAGTDTRNWQSQELAWQVHGAVTLTALSAYLPFRGFNEARNAIMHGQGSLTATQLSPKFIPNTRARLAAAHLRCVRDTVVIAEADLARCANVCAEFVQQLDQAAP